MGRTREQQRRYMRKWRENHREQWNAGERRRYRWKSLSRLKETEDMSLSSKFVQSVAELMELDPETLTAGTAFESIQLRFSTLKDEIADLKEQVKTEESRVQAFQLHKRLSQADDEDRDVPATDEEVMSEMVADVDGPKDGKVKLSQTTQEMVDDYEQQYGSSDQSGKPDDVTAEMIEQADGNAN